MDPNIPVQPVQPISPKKLPQWLTTVTLFSKLLAMILFIALPLAGFYLGMKYQEKTTVITPVVSEVKTTVSPTPYVSKFNDSNAENVTYTSIALLGNSMKRYSISYPITWERNVKRIGEISDELTLSNGEYSIVIYQAPMGGAGCIFEGDVPNGPFGDYRNKKYTEFNSGIGLLRRFDNTPPGISNTRIDFCQKLSDGSFVLSTAIGGLTYKVPNNYNLTILLKMDEIIKTLKEVN